MADLKPHDDSEIIQEIQEFVKNNYEIICNEIKQLHGYVDKNFYLKEEGSNAEYVLRITPEDNFNESLVNATEDVKECLIENGFQINRLRRTKSGERRCCLVADDKTTFYICVFVFLPGLSVQESNIAIDKYNQLAYEVGCLCGLVNKCLLDNSAKLLSKHVNLKMDSSYVWYGANFFHLKRFVSYVPDDDALKPIINEILERFKNFVHPILRNLRQSFVHGDFSNTNIILIKGPEDISSLKSKIGFIDFEDCHIGPIVFDLAVCMAYMMTNTDKGCGDKVALSSNILLGFIKNCPLLQVELDALYWGVLARLITSYVISYYQIAMQPENTEYLLVQSSKCPDLIKLLWNKGKEATLERWLNQD